MIQVTGASSNVGRHFASHLPRTGLAVRSSTRGADSAGLPDGVVDDLEQQADPVTARVAAEQVV